MVKTPKKFNWGLPEFFGRHHVRAKFYHLVSLLFVIVTALWMMDIVSDKFSTITSLTLFAIDYIAEMYDPHPENPGPWFKSHFHRFFDNEE